MKWVLVFAALLSTAACARQDSVVTAPPIDPAPVVSLVGAEVVPGFARITWNVEGGDGHRFFIYRRLQTKPWKNMFTLTTNVDGRMVLEDPSVQPGQRYTYRVRAEGAAPDAFEGEVAIVVPQ